MRTVANQQLNYAVRLYEECNGWLGFAKFRNFTNLLYFFPL